MRDGPAEIEVGLRNYGVLPAARNLLGEVGDGVFDEKPKVAGEP